jgi:hypothetical protein
MNEFPWGVTIGLTIVLSFVIYSIIYILLLDKIEEKQSNVRVQDQKNPKDH